MCEFPGFLVSSFWRLRKLPKTLKTHKTWETKMTNYWCIEQWSFLYEDHKQAFMGSEGKKEWGKGLMYTQKDHTQWNWLEVWSANVALSRPAWALQKRFADIPSGQKEDAYTSTECTLWERMSMNTDVHFQKGGGKLEGPGADGWQ